MALHENEVRLTGNIVKDITFFGDNDSVCAFTVMTKEQWRDKASGELREKTAWHPVKCFGPQAAFMKKYGDKISLVRVKGINESNRFQDAGGETRYEYYVKGLSVDPMRWKQQEPGKDETGPQSAPPQASPQGPSASSGAPAGKGYDPLFEDEEIPF